MLVIGAGTGMMAAITAARNNKRILLLEMKNLKEDSATGNGKCNYTNEQMDLRFIMERNRLFLLF